MTQSGFRKALTILIIVGILVKVIISFENGISDPDTWWHLAAGKYMVDNHAIPHQDIFSWTVSGQEWITHEWLAEVLFYLGYLAGGFWGVLCILLILAGLLLIFYFKLLSMPKDSCLVATLTLIVVGQLIVPFLEIRPQVFSYLFFVVFLYVLYLFVTGGKDYLFSLPLISILWANSHGSFLVGPALVILFIFCGLPRIKDERFTNFHLQKRQLLQLSLCALLCVVAAALNPNGLKLLTYPFATMGDNQMTNAIQEWLSPNFHDLYYQVFLVYYMVTFITMILSPKKIVINDLLLYLIFGAAAFLYIRFIPYALLLSGLIWPRYFQPRLEFKTDLSKVKNFLLPLVLLFYVFVLAVRAPSQNVINHRFTPKEADYPMAALDYLKNHPLKGRMLNDYGWGGYLIWNRPEEKVFIDGRADVYLEKVFGDYINITRLKPEAASLLETYDIDYVFMPASAPLIQALRFSPCWSVYYKDKTTTILVKDSRS
ncbi:MAG: hypothetical protein AB1510_10660 [Bacillota bacterium]